MGSTGNTPAVPGLPRSASAPLLASPPNGVQWRRVRPLVPPAQPAPVPDSQANSSVIVVAIDLVGEGMSDACLMGLWAANWVLNWVVRLGGKSQTMAKCLRALTVYFLVKGLCISLLLLVLGSFNLSAQLLSLAVTIWQWHDPWQQMTRGFGDVIVCFALVWNCRFVLTHVNGVLKQHLTAVDDQLPSWRQALTHHTQRTVATMYGAVVVGSVLYIVQRSIWGNVKSWPDWRKDYAAYLVMGVKAALIVCWAQWLMLLRFSSSWSVLRPPKHVVGPTGLQRWQVRSMRLWLLVQLSTSSWRVTQAFLAVIGVIGDTSPFLIGYAYWSVAAILVGWMLWFAAYLWLSVQHGAIPPEMTKTRRSEMQIMMPKMQLTATMVVLGFYGMDMIDPRVGLRFGVDLLQVYIFVVVVSLLFASGLFDMSHHSHWMKHTLVALGVSLGLAAFVQWLTQMEGVAPLMVLTLLLLNANLESFYGLYKVQGSSHRRLWRVVIGIALGIGALSGALWGLHTLQTGYEVFPSSISSRLDTASRELSFDHLHIIGLRLDLSRAAMRGSSYTKHARVCKPKDSLQELVGGRLGLDALGGADEAGDVGHTGGEPAPPLSTAAEVGVGVGGGTGLGFDDLDGGMCTHESTCEDPPPPSLPPMPTADAASAQVPARKRGVLGDLPAHGPNDVLVSDYDTCVDPDHDVLRYAHKPERHSRYATCDSRWNGLTLLDYALLSQAGYFEPDGPELPLLLDLLFPSWIADGHPPEGNDTTAHGADTGRDSLFELRRLPANVTSRVPSFEVYSKALNTSVIVIRGTDMFRAQDLTEDVRIWAEAAVLGLLSAVFPTVKLWSDRFTSMVIGTINTQLAWFGLGFNSQESYYSGLVAHVESITDRQVVLTGHSLGGGLARIVGSFTGRRSVSFSPPGIVQTRRKLSNRAHDRLHVRDIFNEAVSVIPELDPVSRIDTPSGLVQYILCNETFAVLGCHMMERTICELYASCGDPTERVEGCTFETVPREIKAAVSNAFWRLAVKVLPVAAFATVPIAFHVVWLWFVFRSPGPADALARGSRQRT